MTEVLDYPNLDQYLLLKNGNYLYKVPFRDGYACLKVYYGSRSMLRYLSGTISNWFEGQTSFMPKARRKNEYACLKVWKECGFRVFEIYDDVKVKGLPEGGYTMLEFISGEKMITWLGREDIPLDERIEKYRKFLKDWHRRHKIAVETANPLLVHENGDMKHVMLLPDDEFLYFDFEMQYRSQKPESVRRSVAREILAYLRYTGKAVGAELFARFIDETVAYYPDRSLLELAVDTMYHNPNVIIRWARAYDAKRSKTKKEKFNKYEVADELMRAMNYKPKGL